MFFSSAEKRISEKISISIVGTSLILVSCVLQVLRAMLGLQVTEEQLQSIAERAIQEADLDKDDAISFDEFKKVRLLPASCCIWSKIWALTQIQ